MYLQRPMELIILICVDGREVLGFTRSSMSVINLFILFVSGSELSIRRAASYVLLFDDILMI
jgi:hypothetical protein